MHSGVLLCLFKVLPEAVDHAFAGNQIEGCSRKDLSGCQNRVMRLLAFTGIYKFLRVTGGSLGNKLNPDTASGNVVGNVSEVCASGLFPGRRNAGSLEERGVLHDDLIQGIAGYLVVEILILPDFIGYIRHQSRTLNNPLEALANPVEHIPGIAAQAEAADSAIRNHVGRAGKLRHGIVHSGIFTDVFPQELNGIEAQQQGIQLERNGFQRPCSGANAAWAPFPWKVTV